MNTNMKAYASNETPNLAKRKRLSKYTDMNQALWDWYVMCRNSNIPISGAMLKEEATLIAEKLYITDFVALLLPGRSFKLRRNRSIL